MGLANRSILVAFSFATHGGIYINKLKKMSHKGTQAPGLNGIPRRRQ